MRYYLISFDCESTGLSVYNDQIVEFGAVTNLWDSATGVTTELPAFAEYAKPTIARMGKKAAEITGITTESLQTMAPVRTVLANFTKHLDTICENVDIPRLLLSYNGFSYDIPLVIAEIERYGGSAVAYFRQLRIQHTIDILPFGRACIDRSTLRRRANGSCSYKLGDVYAAVCKCPLVNAHGALADSRAVLEILRCPEMQTSFRTLVTDAVDNAQCQNPMVLVRTILTRISLRDGKKTTQQSKRVVDMVRDHAEKKRKRMQ
jgi:DNA polymerase III alpha subunit (gram-positive type)